MNTFHCFSGWLINATIHRDERGGEREFLEIAQDLAWVIILTLCTTPQKDSNRMSGNWDDNRDLTNNTEGLADARLLGKAR